MNKHILLGVDAPISPATQQALHLMGEFVEQAAPQLHLFLLHVIPVAAISTPVLGMYIGHVQPPLFSYEQRVQAEEALQKARTELKKQGIVSVSKIRGDVIHAKASGGNADGGAWRSIHRIWTVTMSRLMVRFARVSCSSNATQSVITPCREKNRSSYSLPVDPLFPRSKASGCRSR